MTRQKIFLVLGFILLLLGLVAYDKIAVASSSQTTSSEKKTPPYFEVIMDHTTNDPKAQALVEKLLVDDIDMMRQFDNTEPGYSAQFVALGPNLPKTAILAYISHSSVCGSSGCRTVVLAPNEKGTYDIVFDTTLGRIFLNLRNGQPYYDILAVVMPRATDGFGVFFWNNEKKSFVYSGISRFSKQ